MVEDVETVGDKPEKKKRGKNIGLKGLKINLNWISFGLKILFPSCIIMTLKELVRLALRILSVSEFTATK